MTKKQIDDAVAVLRQFDHEERNKPIKDPCRRPDQTVDDAIQALERQGLRAP